MRMSCFHRMQFTPVSDSPGKGSNRRLVPAMNGSDRRFSHPRSVKYKRARKANSYQYQLLAICEGRRRGSGDAGDIDTVFKLSEDGGQSWGKLGVIWDDSTNTCGITSQSAASSGCGC